ncbi:hypothetical protein Tcan_03521 [Toxocara canis]|nr:hypothetical protein Tcan_03521 [Toxocara canis]
MDQNEGSGSPVDWSDDEDIASDGSGSGDGEPPVQPVSTVTQLVPVTPPPPPPPALTKPTVTERPAIRMVSPTKPPAIVSPQPTTKLAQRNLPLSLLVLFLVALCTLVSYF